MEPIIVKGHEKKVLERCLQGPVSFTHAIDMAGKVQPRVIRSTLSPSQQKYLHALALRGLAFEAVTGCGGRGEPPECTVTYSISSLGRLALGCKAHMPEHTRASTALTDEQLEAEGIA
jgi:hypothetical protein